MANDQSAVDQDLQNFMFKSFQDKISHLHLVTDQEKQQDIDNKFRDLVTKTVKFARVICTQRAQFELLFPEPKKYGWNKSEEDDCKTNLDHDYADGDERAGRVWYMIKPGLYKIGDGNGNRFDAQLILRKAVVQLDGDED
jgi:hypothetical protein